MARVRGDIIEMTVSQTQLAAVLGISQPRVNQLIDEGVVVRDEQSKTGEVLLYESLQNYFLSKKATGAGVNFWKERGLHEKAKRELAELKVAARRGELYEAQTVEAVLVELLAAFRSKLSGLPAKYAPRLTGQSRGEIYDLLTSAIEEELTELSDGLKEARFDEDGEEFARDAGECIEADT